MLTTMTCCTQRKLAIVYCKDEVTELKILDFLIIKLLLSNC